MQCGCRIEVIRKRRPQGMNGYHVADVATQVVVLLTSNFEDWSAWPPAPSNRSIVL